MPKNSGDLPMIQWPLFLLSSKVIQLYFDNCQAIMSRHFLSVKSNALNFFIFYIYVRIFGPSRCLIVLLYVGYQMISQ